MTDYDIIKDLPRPAVTVYGASSPDVDKVYFDAARQLGALLAARGVAVVDGGGACGLMGAVNDGALDAGGRAIGVIPRFMAEKGWGHTGLTRMVVAEDMHRRKEMMAAAGIAAIAMPGGVGTFEELLEIMTWRKLGLYHHPVVVLNTDGYYNPLRDMLDHAAARRFMAYNNVEPLCLFADTPAEAVAVALDSRQ